MLLFCSVNRPACVDLASEVGQRAGSPCSASYGTPVPYNCSARNQRRHRRRYKLSVARCRQQSWSAAPCTARHETGGQTVLHYGHATASSEPSDQDLTPIRPAAQLADLGLDQQQLPRHVAVSLPTNSCAGPEGCLACSVAAWPYVTWPHDQPARRRAWYLSGLSSLCELQVIMDGNGRWSQQQGEHAIYGHQQGVQALQQTVRLCTHWNIRCLTVGLRPLCCP